MCNHRILRQAFTVEPAHQRMEEVEVRRGVLRRKSVETRLVARGGWTIPLLECRACGEVFHAPWCLSVPPDLKPYECP
jgi:hypothetical protein